MIAEDGQLAVAIVQEAAAQQPRVHFEIFPAQPALNRHLP